MVAKNKTELLEVTKKEFSKLKDLIDPISDEVALLKDDQDTSIKDVIAHRGHWIDLFLGWYSDGRCGKAVYFPAEGYKWNELKRYNAALRLRQADMGWSDAIEALHGSYGQLIDLLESCSNEELYSGPMKGANNEWTTGRWAEAAGPSHARSAFKYIRLMLKSTG